MSADSKIMNAGGSVRLNPIGVAVLVLLGLLFLYLNMGSSSPDINGDKVSMKRLLSVAIEVAKRGGAEVKTIREQANIGEKSKGKTLEGANNPVTDGDMLSHRAMYYGILKAFPDINVISEEDDPQPIDMSQIQMTGTVQ